jgi:hypothetical protein
MTRQEKWDLLVAAVEADIPGFKVCYKDESAAQRFIAAISVWSWKRDDDGKIRHHYLDMTTTQYPKVWFPSKSWTDEHLPYEVLEHEWTHFKDAGTMFGLFPKARSRFLAVVWGALYLLVPHIFAALALLALLSIWYHDAHTLWILAIAFAAPLPAPFRMWSELRAYRRDVEQMATDAAREEKAQKIKWLFANGSYYYMWPFSSWVAGKLLEPSPYRDEIEAVYKS